jgi:NAD(P)-dependent dehydrogenase (short-subunit alcohol dehydrogenase family)
VRRAVCLCIAALDVNARYCRMVRAGRAEILSPQRRTPMGRLGLSEELANAIVFIASDEASFITGHVLNVDGGRTAN